MTCKYHAASATTRCTRTVSVVAPGDMADVEMIERLAKSWCLQAALYTTRKDQKLWDPREHPALPLEVLDAERSRMPPAPAVIITDQEQMEAAAAAEAAEDAAGAAAVAEDAEQSPDGAGRGRAKL